jgi:DUF4097 and DUF4098 domain-containing protein YvlB
MNASRFLVLPTAALLVVALAPSSARAQGTVTPCPDGGRSSRPSHCEIREMTVPPAGSALIVDAAPNGGISVRAWDKAETRLRAKVTAQADTQADADAIAADVKVLTDGGRIRSEGRRVHDGGWSVSFEVMVPAKHDLSLSTTNGGVSIDGVHGQIEFTTTNGGVNLTNLGGSVRGSTTNGGVQVSLMGGAWEGQGLDVQTRNGGVRLTVPDGYSAHLEVATRNGGIRSRFPVAAQRDGGDKTVSADLGGGGAPVKLTTVNGGVTITER